MTDREKMLEILHQVSGNCLPCVTGDLHLELLATALITNGVTVQKWIPVTERLPKGGAIVLCNTDYFVEVLQWDERADMWCGQYRGYHKSYVTHWMPLPEPPKGE